VRVLEARFHPLAIEDPSFVLVGHLVWSDDCGGESPTVRPSASLMLEKAPATILSKLRHLVSISAPNSFEQLKALRSHTKAGELPSRFSCR